MSKPEEKDKPAQDAVEIAGKNAIEREKLKNDEITQLKAQLEAQLRLAEIERLLGEDL